MAVMNKMREKMAIIMMVLIVAFLLTIVFSWGGGGVDTFMKDRSEVGEVNGQKISINEFYKYYNQMLDQYRQAGMTLDARTTEMVMQQTWDNMVNQLLWQQKIKDLGIEISDEELYYHLENNPPQVLQTQEAFMTDGQFDYSKYLDMLQNPQGNEWVQIENYLRTQVLPYEKLNNMITSSVIVDDHEVLDRFVADNVLYSADYLAAPIRLISDSSCVIFDEDITTYYNEHQDEYTVPEKRYMRTVYWEKVPSADDTAKVFADFKDIEVRVADGESFDELAIVFSEVEDEELTGNIGWFNKDNIREEYADAVFSTKVGTIADPIIIEDEFHLIRVNDSRKTGDTYERNISLIVNSLDPTETYDFYSMEADAFTYDAEEYGFNHALKNTTGILDSVKGDFSREFPYFVTAGYMPSLARWAFNNDVDDISKVFESDKAVIVAQLYAVEKEAVRPLTEVRAQIERGVMAELKSERSSEKMQEIAATLNSAKDLFSNAAADGLEKQSIQFNLSKSPYPFSRSVLFTDAVSSMDAGDMSKPFNVDGYGSVIIRITNKTAIDEDVYEQEKDKLKATILNEKQNAAFQIWLEDLKAKADIKDYRSEFSLN